MKFYKSFIILFSVLVMALIVVGNSYASDRKAIGAEAKENLGEEIYNCYAQVLGEERFWAFLDQDEPASEKQMTTEESARVKKCSVAYSEKLEAEKLAKQAEIDRLQKQYLDYKQCLIDQLGEDEFQAINNQKIEFTETHRKIFLSCQKQILDPPSVDTDDVVKTDELPKVEIPAEMRACLAKVLGLSVFQELLNGKRLATPEEVLKSEQCTETLPIPKDKDKNDRIQYLSTIKYCLVEKFGENRYIEFMDGALPTKGEMIEAETCFEEKGSLPDDTQISEPEQSDDESEMDAGDENSGAVQDDNSDTSTATEKPVGSGEPWQQCMKARVGEGSFKSIVTGEREPTLAELDAAKFCSEQ